MAWRHLPCGHRLMEWGQRQLSSLLCKLIHCARAKPVSIQLFAWSFNCKLINLASPGGGGEQPTSGRQRILTPVVAARNAEPGDRAIRAGMATAAPPDSSANGSCRAAGFADLRPRITVPGTSVSLPRRDLLYGDILAVRKPDLKMVPHSGDNKYERVRAVMVTDRSDYGYESHRRSSSINHRYAQRCPRDSI
jgi:hypothetical protein